METTDLILSSVNGFLNTVQAVALAYIAVRWGPRDHRTQESRREDGGSS